MDYRDMLEYAGAKVLAYEEFGSYQGRWIAKVFYEGESFYITDYFGSCSGCDALEGEFGWSEYVHKHEELNDWYYNPLYDGIVEGCDKCKKFREGVIKFAQKYLEDKHSFDEVMDIASKNLDWDMNAQEMVDWLKEVK